MTAPSKQTFWHQVGEEMKVQEHALRQRLDFNRWTLIRLDGRKFSTFTKGWGKPFDGRLIEAFKATVADLLGEFQPVLAYSQSDEITLVWPPVEPSADPAHERTFMFDGQVMKLCSVAASFCAVRFSHHLSRQSYKLPDEQRLLDKVPTAHFDARVFQLSTVEQVALNLMWRVHDFKRNSMNNLGFHHIGHKRMHGLSPKEVIGVVEEVCGVRWQDLPDERKFGTFAKKKLVQVSMLDRKTQQPVEATRSQIVFGSFDLPGIAASPGVIALLQKELQGDLGQHFS